MAVKGAESFTARSLTGASGVSPCLAALPARLRYQRPRNHALSQRGQTDPTTDPTTMS